MIARTDDCSDEPYRFARTASSHLSRKSDPILSELSDLAKSSRMQLISGPREAATNDPTATNKWFHPRSRFSALEVANRLRDRGEPSRYPTEEMTYPEPSPNSLRQWVTQRHEPSELTDVAITAIDAFEDAIASVIPSSEPLRVLTAAATHPRIVVWDIGLMLIARLGETKDEARRCIVELAQSKKMEHRRRSIQYITDRYPRSFCLTLLSELLADRSAKIRGFAACRIERLNLRELIPLLENVCERETHTDARFELDFSLAMLRNDYYEYENANGYTLVLRCDRLFPPVHHWPGRIAGELVTRENISKHGISIAFDEMRRSHGHEAVRRPWHAATDG